MAAADAAVRDSQNGVRGFPKWDPRTPKMCPEGFLEPKQQEAHTGGPKITVGKRFIRGTRAAPIVRTSDQWVAALRLLKPYSSKGCPGIRNTESSDLGQMETPESQNKMVERRIPEPGPRSTARFQKPSRSEPEATPGSQKPS